MTLKDKENMVKIIRGLYGADFAATPEQISEEVAAILDSIVKEIAACTKKVKPLVDSYELLYTSLPLRTIAERLSAKFIKTTLDNIISNWTQEAKKRFATRACTNNILLKWRTRLQEALSGI